MKTILIRLAALAVITVVTIILCYADTGTLVGIGAASLICTAGTALMLCVMAGLIGREEEER